MLGNCENLRNWNKSMWKAANFEKKPLKPSIIFSIQVPSEISPILVCFLGFRQRLSSLNAHLEDFKWCLYTWVTCYVFYLGLWSLHFSGHNDNFGMLSPHIVSVYPALTKGVVLILSEVLMIGLKKK